MAACPINELLIKLRQKEFQNFASCLGQDHTFRTVLAPFYKAAPFQYSERALSGGPWPAYINGQRSNRNRPLEGLCASKSD